MKHTHLVQLARHLSRELESALFERATEWGMDSDDLDWRNDIEDFWDDIDNTYGIIGEGCGRIVIDAQDTRHVVKLPIRWDAWQENRAEAGRWLDARGVRTHLAPVVVGEDRYVIQRRCAPGRDLDFRGDFYRVVNKVAAHPAFEGVRDIDAVNNWGLLGRKLVLLDYGYIGR